MNSWARFLVPASVVAVAVAYLGLMMLPPDDPADGFHLQEFGRLPALENGRVKPFDTVARTDLMLVSEREVYTDEAGATQPAVKWLLDAMSLGQAIQDPALKEYASRVAREKVFRITNDQVLSMLGLPERPGSYRYSLEEFGPHLQMIGRRAAAARDRDASQRDLVDEHMMRLAEQVQRYLALASWDRPLDVAPPAKEGHWRSLRDQVDAEDKGGPPNRSAAHLQHMLEAYAQDRPADFNRELDAYRHELASEMPAVVGKADFEAFFNNFNPFWQCCILYPAVFLLACFSWIGFRQPLRHAALGLLLVLLVAHGFGLFGRMYLMERPLVFVTNLYSSAIFIGWIGAILCVVLELIFRNSIGNAVAGALGFATSVIAVNLAAGDTIEMMRAVLDTNFWLATHVTCVTFGYAATFVAGLLGIILIFYALGCHLTSRPMDREVYLSLSRMVYGVVCFATLLSFTGTVLGGIWADQSWGRFWGWDPKENGALLIVLWNALILHARWGGLVKQRGVAVLAVFGNIMTSWSWFGVNMLGVGLHSYGFMAAAVPAMLAFILSQLTIITLGLLPLPVWKQLTPVKREAPEPAAPRPRLRHDSPYVTASR